MIGSVQMERKEMSKCNDCKWFVYGRALTRDEWDFMYLSKKLFNRIVTFDTRICCLGGCKDYERYEKDE